MDWIMVGLAGAVMLVLAIIGSYVLGRASRAWHVKEDPLVEKVQEALAGLDCGACGYPTCNAYAHAIVEEGDEVDKCAPGGHPTAVAVAELMGVEVPEPGDTYAVVHCGARSDQRHGKTPYHGVPTCAASNLVPDVQGCVYGCLGLGDCERSCPFDAIHVIDGLAVVDFAKCTACGNCVRACPRDIITLEPFPAGSLAVVACCNLDTGREVKQVCDVGCIACGICQRTCELFEVHHCLSHVSYEDYDPARHHESLREASEQCPTGCLPFRGPAASADSHVQPQQEESQ